MKALLGERERAIAGLSSVLVAARLGRACVRPYHGLGRVLPPLAQGVPNARAGWGVFRAAAEADFAARSGHRGVWSAIFKEFLSL